MTLLFRQVPISLPAQPPALASRGAGAVGLRPRPSTAATRSPDTIIPATIAAPKTMYCIAVDSPRITSICVSSVSAKAAIHVDVVLAKPPASDAPAITTAAIGASRYAEPNAGSRLMLTPASRTAATA